MKILNRPMFRYGGPIKEGIMNGIQEPRRIGYAVKGTVSAADQAKAFENIFTTPQVTQEQVTQFANPPYRENFLQLNKPYMKKTVTKPTDLRTKSNYSTMTDDTEVPVFPYEKIPKYIPNPDDPNGVTIMNPEYKENKTFLSDIIGGPYRQKKDVSSNIETGKASGTDMPPMLDQSGKMGATTIDQIIKDRGKVDDTPLTKKERTNNILEMLGYDKAKKNALYDAMINAGQRISRTGLGADNLVSDIIQDTSTVYDKPEKLREAANLMDVQQQLKLDQISASKTGGATKQSYDFFIEQGYSKEVAERKARNLPTTISEYFTASKASTDTGKLYDATRAATEEGVFGNVEYKGKIDSTKHKKLSEFLSSEELKSKGDGVYNILGEAVIIVDGQVKSRQVIQPKVDKKGWFD